MAKGTPLGPRVIIAFGKVKKGKATVDAYVRMVKTVAEFFGYTPVTKIPTVKTKGGKVVPVPGAKGSKSIKVPTGKTAGAGEKKYAVYKSMPVPATATIEQINTFLSKATKVKPDHFVSPDGRSWPVTANAK